MRGTGPPIGSSQAHGIPNSYGMQNLNATKGYNRRDMQGKKERKRMRTSAKKFWTALGRAVKGMLYQRKPSLGGSLDSNPDPASVTLVR